MDIKKMLNKRFGNTKGYEDGVIYTEVLNDVVYKTYQNGVVRYKKRLDKGSLPTEKEVRQNLEWLVPKIPFKYYLMVLDFYKDVNEKYHTEACALFYWNKDNVEIPQDLLEQYGSGIIQDGQLIVIAPKQTNSAGLSQYVEDVTENGITKRVLTPMVQWLEDNMVCMLETHSHNTMPAFWSSTDDNNERHSRLRLYAVIGKVSTEEMVKSRVHLLGEYFDLQIEDIFEMPMLKIAVSLNEDGQETNLLENLPTYFPRTFNEEVQYYTGPFAYTESHPKSWFDLFSLPPVRTKPVSTGTFPKYSKFNNYSKQDAKLRKHLAFLDDEEGEDVFIDEELDSNGEPLAVEVDFDDNGNPLYNILEDDEEEPLDDDVIDRYVDMSKSSEDYFRPVVNKRKRFTDMTDAEFLEYNRKNKLY